MNSSWWLYAGAAAAAGAAGLAYWKRDYFVGQVMTVVEGAKDAPMADPSLQDLRSALGPTQEGALTLIIALEHVLVNRDWDRRYGHRVELRAGIKEFLQQCAEAGAVLTVWSDGNSMGGVETLMRIGAELGIALQATQLHLGSEHTFFRPGEPHRREKHLEHFSRHPGSVLLVDYDPLSEEINPFRCLVVRKMAPPQVEDGPKEALSPTQAAKAAIGAYVARGEEDLTLKAVAAVVKRIRSDANTYGHLDVPGSLERLRAEAELRGFSHDAEGLSGYLAHAAAAKMAEDAARTQTGFGGLLRQTLERSPAFRRKPTTIEAASARPFRDPALDSGPGSLLTQKVHAANERFEAMLRQQQAGH